MMNTLRRVGAVLLLAACAGLAGCTKPPTKIKFNNVLARQSIKLGEAGKGFYGTIAPLKDGNRVNANSVRQALNQCQSVVDESRAEHKELVRPPRSPAGIELRDRFSRFLSTQQDIIDECLLPIAQIV